MAGTAHAPTALWLAVILMITGFIMCTVGFIIDNNLILWILGGVVGAVGLLLAKSYGLMAFGHD